MAIPPILWQPSERAIEEAQITQFARQIVRKRRLELNSYPEFYRWTVDNPEEFWSDVWTSAASSPRAGARACWWTATRLPGARWFPEARLNFAENLMRRGDRGDASCCGTRGASSGASRSPPSIATYRARCRRCRRSACARAIAPPPSSRTSRSRHAGPRRPVAGHRLVVLLARFRRRRRRRALWPDRAEGAVLHRRLPLQRPGARHARAGARNRRAAADAEKGGSGPTLDEHVDVSDVPKGVRLDEWLRRYTAGDIAFAQLPFDHRCTYCSPPAPPQAEVHRARRGRRAAAEPQDAQAAVRRAAGRPLLLFLHHQLGGVEPAVRRALRGGERDALRRLALRAQRQILFDCADQERFTHFGTSAKYIDAWRSAACARATRTSSPRCA